MKQFFLPVAFLFCLLSGSAQNERSLHFTIEKLADGVYAAIATNGGFAICNAGIIDLGGQTLVFDPFMTPEAAVDLRQLAEKLTGHKVTYVVNSHFHNDHIGGNQVFEDAVLISTERTRELILQYQPVEIAEVKTSARPALEKMLQRNREAKDPHEVEESRIWKGYYEALVRSADTLRTVAPAVTFAKRLEMHGSRRHVLLLCYGEGHTESDLFLYLPEEKIAFLGDLLFVGDQPWVGDGNTASWTNYLDSIKQLKAEVLVPGHGPVGNYTHLDSMKLYFRHLHDRARAYHSIHKLPQDDGTMQAPAPFNSWHLDNFYKPNVIAVYNRMYPAKKD